MKPVPSASGIVIRMCTPSLAEISSVLSLLMATSGSLGQGTAIHTRRLADSVTNPVLVASAPGDLGRLFVGARTGQIYVFDLPTGTRHATPFLAVPNTGPVNGLLNIAFDPRWRQNGVFYVSLQGTTYVQLLRGRISALDPNVADPASLTTIMSTFTASGQHTGGLLAFGSDGHLYFSSGDQSGSPQDLSSWGGKLFRIDPDGPDGIPGNDDDDQFPSDANRNYAIPPDNPFVSTPNARPEIWALGLRNPYRCSVDPLTGEIWIGDVGGSYREEVDILPPSAPGINFGWPTIEGTRCNASASACAALVSTPPLIEYPHLGTGTGLLTGAAIIGGVVYRGCAMPHFRGTYFFGDNFGGWIASVRREEGRPVALTKHSADLGTTQGVSCIGADALGEMYYCSYSTGGIYAIEPTAAHDCNHNGVPDACEGLGVCWGDFNGDCATDAVDLIEFLAAYSAGSLGADYDDGSGRGLADGAVTIDDLLRYLDLYGAGC